MYATRKASTKPTATPNRIPKGTEFTFRAKMPAATPAMSPLTVDPTIMPASWTRTAGVNHAVAPSIAPSNAPSSSPSSTLFITFLRRDLSLVFLTTNPRIPLSLSVHKKQNRYPHHQIRSNQQYEEPVPAVKTPSLFQSALPVGADREPVQISRNIQRQLLNAGIALRRSRGRRFCANGRQRFIEAASTRNRSYFRLAGKQESQ